MFLPSGEGLVGGVPPQIRQKTAISIFMPMVDPHCPDHVTWPHFHPIYFEPKDAVHSSEQLIKSNCNLTVLRKLVI